LLAALAGRIYDHAPQQNAFPLGNEQANLQRQTKASVERRVRAAMWPHIAAHVRLVNRTDRLIFELVDAHNNVPNNSRALRAKTILLARIGNDARAMATLARSGYVMQSWAIGTSILEHCYAIGHIGTNEARAEQWFAHSDLRATPWKARAALRSMLIKLEIPQMEEAFYRHFTRLSAAKHGNPVYQSRFGVRNEPTVTRIQLDLFFTPNIARLARAGLLWAMHGVGLAMWSFTYDQLPQHQRGKAVERFVTDTFKMLEAMKEP
jgi:hypothetical protein